MILISKKCDRLALEGVGPWLQLLRMLPVVEKVAVLLFPKWPGFEVVPVTKNFHLRSRRSGRRCCRVVAGVADVVVVVAVAANLQSDRIF